MKKKLIQLIILLCFLSTIQKVSNAQNEIKEAQKFADINQQSNPIERAGTLGDFAQRLEKNSDINGYIFCYGSKGKGYGSCGDILLRAKEFLIREHIKTEQIKTIYAGHFRGYKEVAMELWLVPKDATSPQPQKYGDDIKIPQGKFHEYVDYEDTVEDSTVTGFVFGTVGLAAFADALQEQPNTVAYIVAYNGKSSNIGAWRRAAKLDVWALENDHNIAPERIKIIFGGYNDKVREQRVEWWIVSQNAQQPVQSATLKETLPAKAILVGRYEKYRLDYRYNLRWIFEGFADILKENKNLRVCLIFQTDDDNGYFQIGWGSLIEKWKNDLIKNYKIGNERLVIYKLPPRKEGLDGYIELWIIPKGAMLPNPYAVDEDEESDEEIP